MQALTLNKLAWEINLFFILLRISPQSIYYMQSGLFVTNNIVVNYTKSKVAESFFVGCRIF